MNRRRNESSNWKILIGSLVFRGVPEKGELFHHIVQRKNNYVNLMFDLQFKVLDNRFRNRNSQHHIHGL